MGLTYFNAEVTVEDEEEKQDVNYGYSSLYAGVHLKF